MEGFVKTIDPAMYTDIYIFTHLTASYDFKMRERWGIYFDYIRFVETNTPTNTSILAPPQQLPWLSTGNVGLDRYFLYPRKMGNGDFEELTDLQNYDYVMLVWGEWNDAREGLYGWPKVPIKAEKVIYFDTQTGRVTEKLGNYDPKTIPASGAWGLIKVKK